MFAYLASAVLILALGHAPQAAAADRIIVQSTTSTQNSGLLDAILPEFTDQTGIEAAVVAVGTGQAIANAMRGDADVLLVHAPDAEEAFVAAGHGVQRHKVMYNDFVIVGPRSDPAMLKGSDLDTALVRLAKGRAPFLSRGDDSGTHKVERRLWEAAGISPDPAGPWYRETGQGMGATLNVAIGMDGYTMVDRATWIAFGNKGHHGVLLEGDPRLFNQYGVIAVDADRHPSVNGPAALDFVDWITGPDGQAAIAGYQVNGTQLFIPNADRPHIEEQDRVD